MLSLALFAVAVSLVTFVAGGIPVLRHDWFPIIPSLHFAIANVTGWDPTGMGSATGYPASFLFVFVRSAVAVVAGSYVAHISYYAAYAVLLVFGAARLAAVLGESAIARVAAALVAAFNPWAYTQLVAGHGFMMFSYAAMFWLVAECCASSPSSLRLVLIAIAVSPQIQFVAVASILYVWLAVRMRSMPGLLAIGSMLLPVVVGVLANRSALLGIPLNLDWERGQSIFPFRAVFLRGYFTGYDTALPGFYEWTMWIVAAIALAGVLSICISARNRSWLIAFTAIPLLWSFGLAGPFSSVFSAALVRFPETSLFRELYDLLGFVAIGYVALCAAAARRNRFLGALWLAAGAAMFVAWTSAPPAKFWIDRRAVPTAVFASTPNSRFLLLPAIGPLKFGYQGSGADPDLYPRRANQMPVNEAFLLYPVSAAVGKFMRDGSTDSLAALSVERVVARPWLATEASVVDQLALPFPRRLLRTIATSTTISNALPELTLGAPPVVGTLDANFGAGNVLFSDAATAQGPLVPRAWHAFDPVLPVSAGNAFVKASEGWVDARLAFTEAPNLAQPFGGAMTTNGSATLRLEPGDYALVLVRGRMVARDGLTVTEGNGRFAWVHIPESVDLVRCSGFCLVATQTKAVPRAPLDPPKQNASAVGFTALFPWLVVATIPPGPQQLLRYNVTYDDKWLAMYEGSELSHLRIDGIVNGWLVPARRLPSRIVLVETAAVLTALSEFVAVVSIVVIVIACRIGRSKTSAGFEDQSALRRSISAT